MTGPLANKIGVVNQGSVYNQTNHIIIHQGQQVALIYSDPVPDLRFFQGRETELSHLNFWLADRAVKMIGVRGEGGIGKSTLVAKAFAECLGFAGKFWADVRTGTSITVLAARALQELGVLPDQVQAIEEKDLIPRLLRHLQQGHYLLAIDNLESVLTATGEWQSGYETFLDGFQALGGESVLLLASREYPPKYFGWKQSRWLTVEQGLEPAKGAALLAALEVEDMVENRAAISIQVQGNPLALSLVAGWLRQEYRPGERTIEPLRWQTDLLQVEGKHRGETQISVDRVLQWSLDRLTSTQQHLLTQVSVLRGAFNATAAAALVPEQSVSDPDLEDLERRSLVQHLPERDKSGLSLFRLQPRIREFVQRCASDLTTAHERAIAYFWSQRQTEFAPEDTQDTVSHYEDTFYHQCQLGRYADAAVTAFACTEFLFRRGSYQALVDFYHPLHTDWHPTPDQRYDYATVCNHLGNAYSSIGQYQRAIDLYQQSLTITRQIGETFSTNIALRNSEVRSLIGLGDVYQSIGQYQRVITFCQQSLEITRKIGAAFGTNIALRNGEARSLGSLGNAYSALGQYQRAIDLYQQALEITREIGEASGTSIALRNSEARSRIGLGNAYSALGQYQQAIDLYQQALKITHKIGDRKGKATSISNLGLAYQSRGQSQQAINFYQQALKITHKIGDRNGEAGSLIGLGLGYQYLGQYQQAIDCHQQALAIQHEIGARNGEARSIGNLGLAYQSLGQYPQAIDFHQQSLAITREIGDRNGEATSLMNLGLAYQSLGQYQQAIDFHQQALEIQHEIGDYNGKARSIGNLGLAYQSLGQYQRAIDLFQQALEITCEIGDRNGESSSLGNLGSAYYSLGQYQRAIDLFQQSLAIAREIGDHNGEATCLGNLGGASHSLGQCQQAIDFLQQALTIKREIGDRNGEATALVNLGKAYHSTGQYPQAIDFYQQSLAIQREIGTRNGEANSLLSLGLVYHSVGQYPQAIDFLQQSLAITQEIGDRNGEATALVNLGLVYHSRGQLPQAIDFYQQSLAIQREIGARNGEALSLWNLGHCYPQQGKIRKGRECRLAALRIWQSLNLPIDVIPIPETTKRMFRTLAQQGHGWAELTIQSNEQLGWFMDMTAGIGFLMSLPVRLVQRFKTSVVFWLLVGIGIVLLIGWLGR